jgi:Lysozyme like domain
MIALVGFLVFIGVLIYEFEQNTGQSAAVSSAVSQVENFVTGKLSPAQIAQYAANAGFTGQDLITAVAVALAESGGDPNAYNPETAANAPSGKGSYGLWQIYLNMHPEFAGQNLYDPATNAAAAFAVYMAAGGTFTPWSTYLGGAYLAQLDAAQGAVNG